MAQSYGNPSFSPILAAQDEVVGVEISTQVYGTSISARGPAEATVTSTTLTLALDGGAPVTITIPATRGLFNIATAIQGLVRAAGVGAEYSGFIARYDPGSANLILVSGTSGASPAVPATAVVVSGGTAASLLKLGAVVGGTESSAALPYQEYSVFYRLVSGSSVKSQIVKVLSTSMTLPYSVTQAVTLADEIAAQCKAVGTAMATVVTDTSANGPVSL